VNGASRPRGSVAPSRTAAIGGTLVARSAGKRPASTVTTTPTSRLTTTVRVANTMLVVGRSSCSALKRLFRPLARAMPSASPINDERRPIRNASSTTERSTCPREAPSVLSVANSRVRWATVIERVLKMTNAPTKSAIAAKASRK
jgi:hypothetical protein